MDETGIIRTARAQHGLITVDQAADLGLGRRSIRTRLANGAWEQVHPGVYVVGSSQRTWTQAVAAACLAAGEGTFASHRTAARIWGFVEHSGRIELLTHNTNRLRIKNVTAHRSLLLDARDHTIRNGVPLTTTERTILDLATAGDERVIGAWIDTGLRNGVIDLDRLVEFCGRLGGPGRGVPHAVLAALAVRRPGYNPGHSALESRALSALAEAGLPEPVRQHPVTRPDGRVAYIDLAYPDAPLAIELDGYETHGTRAAFEDDRVRGNELVLLGWPVLRFTWRMSGLYLCETVARALDRAA